MINNADDGGLSAQLMTAETTVNNFFFRCFDRLYRSRNLSYIDTLQNDIDKYVGEVKFKYVDDYIKYRKAAAVMIVGEKKAIAQYIDNQEILFQAFASFLMRTILAPRKSRCHPCRRRTVITADNAD